MAMRAIDEALPRAAADDVARRVVAKNLADYSQVLRLHIDKEHDLLFPLADEALSDEEQQAMAAEFERIEREETGAGVHERYHALAHALSEPVG
jgi:hemerythrin-like domain-containing protein